MYTEEVTATASAGRSYNRKMFYENVSEENRRDYANKANFAVKFKY